MPKRSRIRRESNWNGLSRCGGGASRFEYHNPTRLIFGAGSLSRLGEFAQQFGRRALLVTGGGSVKRNGSFERAVQSLTEAGISLFECEGVEPNPKISSVKRGAATARENACDLVIALGGGSVMDASKVVAAAALYDGDPWDMIFHGQPDPYLPTEALPAGCLFHRRGPGGHAVSRQ